MTGGPGPGPFPGPPRVPLRADQVARPGGPSPALPRDRNGTATQSAATQSAVPQSAAPHGGTRRIGPPPVDGSAVRGVVGPRAGRPVDNRPTDVIPAARGSEAIGASDESLSSEVPGRHRRRAGESTDARAASEYRAEAESGGGRERPRRRRRPTFWKELPLLIVVALALTFGIQTFLAKVYVIPSGSMETTLHGCSGCNNDRVLVDKVSYRFTSPKPGDVVVFRGPDSWKSEFDAEPPSNALVSGLQQLGSLVGLAPPDEKDFVKRVIAVGGQTVQCCDSRNRVLVDKQPLDEPYVYFLPAEGTATQKGFGPIRVPDGQLWMMGDSRNNSADSRVAGHGPIPLANVIGKARLIVLPFTRFGWIPSDDPQTQAVSMGASSDPVTQLPGALGLLALPHLVRRRRTLAADDPFLPRR